MVQYGGVDTSGVTSTPVSEYIPPVEVLVQFEIQEVISISPLPFLRLVELLHGEYSSDAEPGCTGRWQRGVDYI